jgi:hypothetical protein
MDQIRSFTYALQYTDSIPVYLRWLKHLSFFNYAFEALIVNEMLYLQLTEKKYGLEIDVSLKFINYIHDTHAFFLQVPGATILSTFGFDASAYWSDATKLCLMCIGFLISAFICLTLLVRERR